MLPIVIACLWVIAAAAVSFLPMRYQYVPGVALLCAAPFLIFWIGLSYGAIWAALGLAGFVSMFRRPLWYFFCKFTGRLS